MRYQGRPHVLAIARDVTENKQAAEHMARQRDALHQREKLAALGSLLAGVSHELNNPLSVVVARSIMLEEKVDSGTRASITKIRAAAERCARIVRTFLAMARQQRPERSATSVNETIAAALDIAGYAIRTSGIEVTLDLAGDLPAILADADQLHQVMLNLIINAQQALQKHPAPRRIVLGSCYERTDESIRITVADNGPGIPANIIGRIFEPYFTTKPVGTGLGAGLAVSLGIIETHDGTLTVECPGNAGGTVFTIKLPATPPEAQHRDADPGAEAYKRRLSILVIDDEEGIRETLAEILESAEHQVTLAASGGEALERLDATPFDVILSDIRMPDMDGLSLHEKIRQRWPDKSARMIFVTGDTLTATLAEWAAQSGCPVIEKPFLPSEVLRFVAGRAAETILRIEDGDTSEATNSPGTVRRAAPE
jgi:two-component system NtrC family sensor kinase